MPILKTKDKTILYIHIPKCGGTSIEGWLEQYGVIALLDRKHSDVYSKCSPQHIHAEVLEKFFCKEYFDYVFIIVRNPYSRIISEYNMRRTFGNNKQISFSDWLKNAISSYKKNPWYLDNHLRPQSDFICFDCDVFKLEDDISRLSAKFSLLLNQSVAPVPHSFKNTSPFSINELNDDDRNMIAEMYAEDFSRFGYTL